MSKEFINLEHRWLTVMFAFAGTTSRRSAFSGLRATTNAKPASCYESQRSGASLGFSSERALRTFEAFPNGITAVALTPDGKRRVAVSGLSGSHTEKSGS
jgi:hypothetical protein